MNRRSFIEDSLQALAQTALAMGQAIAGTPPAPGGQESRRIPNVPVVTHQNQPARFYDDLIKGKHVLINFMYASCPDSCPLQTANLALVQKALAPRVGKDIFMYSITLDPRHDTPAVLKAYSERFNIGPGWSFLSGTEQDMELIRRRLGFVDPNPVVDKDKASHIGVVLYGNDQLDRWAGCPAMSRAMDIAEYVQWMDDNREKLRKWDGISRPAKPLPLA
ncbi:MAG: SCO family protein [Nitrospira sp.]|nr:SCO family protein [Nitrospira sp.]